MTLAEFLADQSKTLTAVEFLDEQTIINIVINDGQLYGLAVDTSTVVGNPSVTRRDDFTLDGNILTVGDYSVDITTLHFPSYNRY